MLADMGADVVKVEPLTGDVVRGMSRKAKGAPDIDHSFHCDNRGKRSIAIALDRPDGARGRAPAGRPRRRVPVQPAAAPPGALRARPGDAARDATVGSCTPRCRGYGLVGPDVAATGLRRDDVLRPRRDHRRDDRAGWRRPDAARRPRAITRPASPWSPRSSPALRVAERTGEGRSSTSACSPPRRGRWPATWRRRSSTAARSTKRDRHHLITPLGQPVPLRRTTAGSSSTCPRPAGGRRSARRSSGPSGSRTSASAPSRTASTTCRR